LTVHGTGAPCRTGIPPDEHRCEPYAIARDIHLVPEIILDQQKNELGNRWTILNTDAGRQRATKLNVLAQIGQSADATPESRLLVATSSNDDASRW
jgi:hypothetical protein